MVNGPEHDFWKTVRNTWQPNHAVRVEASFGCVDPGTPDVVVGHNGRNGWIELKIWPDTLSEVQIAWHTDALDQGSYAMVLTKLSQGVWLGRFDRYMEHFKWERNRWMVVRNPKRVSLHDALRMIESALS